MQKKRRTTELRTRDGVSGSGCWIESSPSLGPNGEVYFHHNCLGVVALDSTVSPVSPLWIHDGLGQAFNTTSVGPDGTVYVGNSDHNFYALDPATGNTKPGWPVPVTNFMYNASASVSQDGSRIYRGNNGGIFYAFNSTASVACQYDTGGGGIFSAPALSANDVVYFTQAALQMASAMVGSPR
jgi:outer membrane protein assembly factor BamB